MGNDLIPLDLMPFEDDSLKGLIEGTEDERYIRLKSGRYFFDANTLTLPFAGKYTIPKNEKGELQPILRYEILEEKGEDFFKTTVEGGLDYGVPTVADVPVVIAIQKCFIKKNLSKNRVKFKLNEITLEDRTCSKITIAEIAREMGKTGNLNKHVKSFIESSIMRLSKARWNLEKGLTFTSNSEKLKEISTNSVGLFDVVRTEVYATKKTNKDDKRPPKKIYDNYKFIFSEAVYLTLANSLVAFYEEDNLNKIKQPFSKVVYLTALKYSGKNGFWITTFNDLCNMVPCISKENPKDRLKEEKRIIKNTIKELNETFLKIVVLSNGVIKMFVTNKMEEIVQIETKRLLLDRFKTKKEIEEYLKDKGFSEQECTDILLYTLNNKDYLRALLRYTEYRISTKKDIAKPKNFIHSAVVDGYNIPKEFYGIENVELE